LKTKIIKWMIGTFASILIILGGLFFIPMYLFLQFDKTKFFLLIGISMIILGGVIIIAIKFYNMTKHTETKHHHRRRK